MNANKNNIETLSNCAYLKVLYDKTCFFYMTIYRLRFFPCSNSKWLMVLSNSYRRTRKGLRFVITIFPWNKRKKPRINHLLCLFCCRFMLVLVCLIFSVLSTIDAYSNFANETLFWMVRIHNSPNKVNKHKNRAVIFN